MEQNKDGGHEDLKVAKKVICIYFKKSNKKSKGLPDTDCRQEIRSPQEMMQHIQEEHPWLKWTKETSKKHFEEEIKALEEYELEFEDNRTSETADKITQEVQISNDEKDKDAEDRCKECEFKVSGVRRSKRKQKLKAHMNKHHPVGLSIAKVSKSDDKQIPMSKYEKMHIA